MTAILEDFFDTLIRLPAMAAGYSIFRAAGWWINGGIPECTYLLHGFFSRCVSNFVNLYNLHSCKIGIPQK